MEENKSKALNLLAEYHNIFTLEDGEMGCTEATVKVQVGVMPGSPSVVVSKNC